jgi:hypothetical protein
MNDLGALLADFSGGELDGVDTSNETALLSPESVSAARAESAEDTGSKSGGIGACASREGGDSSQRGLEQRRSIGSSF